MARYEFVDHWYVRAPIEQVFDHVADPRTYPNWWPVYPAVKILKEGSEDGVGGQARLVVKSALGYKLNIDVETIESSRPSSLQTVSKGDLEGTGKWEFQQEGDTTHVTFTWIVETHRRLLNFLEPVAKPLFAWSHNDASGKGHRGLKRLLEQE